MDTHRKLVCAVVCALALDSGAVSAGQWAKTYGNSAAETGALIPISGGGFYLHGTMTSVAQWYLSINAKGNVKQ